MTRYSSIASTSVVALSILSGCAADRVVIKDWCFKDHVLSISHSDTAATQADVLQHNADFLRDCPK